MSHIVGTKSNFNKAGPMKNKKKTVLLKTMLRFSLVTLLGKFHKVRSASDYMWLGMHLTACDLVSSVLSSQALQ